MVMVMVMAKARLEEDLGRHDIISSLRWKDRTTFARFFLSWFLSLTLSDYLRAQKGRHCTVFTARSTNERLLRSLHWREKFCILVRRRTIDTAVPSWASRKHLKFQERRVQNNGQFDLPTYMCERESTSVPPNVQKLHGYPTRSKNIE